MISCYTLLAVYLSTAGSLEIPLLDHSYSALKDNANIELRLETEKGKFHIMIDPIPKYSNNNTQVDACQVKKVTYYGSLQTS